MLKFEADHRNKQVNTQLSELDDRTRRGIRQFWFALGKSLLKSFNKEVLRKPRSGRVYKIRRGRTKRRHVASSPGETPANISGTYRKSAGYQIQGTNQMTFGNSSDYSGFLENGTTKMEPRPGLGNAVKETEGESLQDAATLIEREITKR